MEETGLTKDQIALLGEELRRARKSTPPLGLVEGKRRASRFMSVEEAARALTQVIRETQPNYEGVSVDMMYRYERGEFAPPFDIAKAGEKVYRLTQGSLTNVYYNRNRVDSGSTPKGLPELHQLNEFLAVRARKGDATVAWSAKGRTTLNIRVSAFLGAARVYIYIGDRWLKQVRPETVLLFERDSYPYQNIWLLVQSKKDPDIQAIRYIDAQGAPDVLLSADPNEPPVKLADWDIWGRDIALLAKTGPDTYGRVYLDLAGVSIFTAF